MSAAFVQSHGSNECAAGSSSFVVTLSGTHTAGNMLLLGLDFVTNTRLATIVDNNGNTWTQYQRRAAAGKTTLMASYSGAQVVTSVTVTFNGTSGGALASLLEYSGSSGDGESGNSATSAAGDPTVNWTPGYADELSVGVMSQIIKPADGDAAAGWTRRVAVSHSAVTMSMSVYDDIGLAAVLQTFSTTPVISSGSWTAIVESFLAPSVASGSGGDYSTTPPSKQTMGTNGARGRIHRVR